MGHYIGPEDPLQGSLFMLCRSVTQLGCVDRSTVSAVFTESTYFVATEMRHAVEQEAVVERVVYLSDHIHQFLAGLLFQELMNFDMAQLSDIPYISGECSIKLAKFLNSWKPTGHPQITMQQSGTQIMA